MIDFNDDFISQINAHLAAGGVIAFPTDTVWGLGALPTAAGAESLFEIKQRPREKHFIIMSDSLEHLRPHMRDFSPRAIQLAEKYWPGALTIVGNDDPVFGGVRIPNNEIFRELCNHINGHCLATTSANISGEPTCESAKEIAQVFPNVLIIGDDNEAGIGRAGPYAPPPLASTVIKVTGDEIQILRQGSVVI